MRRRTIAQATAHQMPFPAASFHAAVFSPPYFGLRSYHGDQITRWPGGAFRELPEAFEKRGVLPMECGLGEEPLPAHYVWHMVLIFRELRRVVRPDGVIWMNISDSYNGSGGAGGDYNEGGLKEGQPRYPGRMLESILPGNVIGVPWRLAFALQADDWIIRGVPAWIKMSVMPEPANGWRWQKPPCSCMTERREASIKAQMEEQGVERHRVYKKAGDIGPDPNCPICKGTGEVQDAEDRLSKGSWRHTRAYEQVFMLTQDMGYWADREAAKMVSGNTKKNPRDLLKPGRTNYSGDHFAPYPPDLVAPLIAATVPRKACATCGTGYAPVLREKRLTGYRPSCDCPEGEPVPGRVLDPFFGSGSTAIAANELGVDWTGIDISRKYLVDEAAVRLFGATPQARIDELPLFGGVK